MAYTKYSLTPADNNAAPPNGAPEGMLPSAVNDTMRDMMSQIRDVGDGIRGGTYTMTAPVITGGSITGVALSGNTLTNPVITGGSINNTTVGATTRSTGAFTTLASNGATTFTAGTASTSTTTGTAVITGGLGVSGRINAANFDGIVGANTAAAGSFTTLSASSTVSGTGFSTYLASPPAIGGTAAAAGNFTTLGATGVATFSAGTVSAPAITTTGDTNTGIFFPAADTIAFTEGGVESMRIDSTGNVLVTGYGRFGGSLAFIGKSSDLVSGGSATDTAFRYDGNNLVFAYSNTERMRIDSSGNVGIGTSSPVYQTQIYGSGQTTAALTDAGNKGGSLLLNTPTVAGGDGGALLIGAGGSGAKPFAAVKGLLADGGGNTTGSLAFSTRNATGDTALTERMRIDSSGNVGIGTSSPLTNLDVRASSGSKLTLSTSTTIVTSGQNLGSIVFQAPNEASGSQSILPAASISAVATVANFNTTNNDTALVFSTNATGASPTERMRIDGSGRVLVGLTSANTSGANLQVSQGITFPATQSASSDANTLDDYEEGTWTPTVSGVTLASASGTYTKIGRQVFVAFDITWPTTSNTTAITIGSMPFAPTANSGAMSTAYTTYTSALVGAAGTAGIALYGYLGNPASAPQNIHLSTLRLIASATYTV
jgi:hypothetical protein